MMEYVPTSNAPLNADAADSDVRGHLQQRERLPAAAERLPDHTTQAPRTRTLRAAAVGAVALGALAIGALAIGRLVIRRAHIGRLEIGELVVHGYRGDELR
jgi:hypothetical protein